MALFEGLPFRRSLSKPCDERGGRRCVEILGYLQPFIVPPSAPRTSLHLFTQFLHIVLNAAFMVPS